MSTSKPTKIACSYCGAGVAEVGQDGMCLACLTIFEPCCQCGELCENFILKDTDWLCMDCWDVQLKMYADTKDSKNN